MLLEVCVGWGVGVFFVGFFRFLCRLVMGFVLFFYFLKMCFECFVWVGFW